MRGGAVLGLALAGLLPAVGVAPAEDPKPPPPAAPAPVAAPPTCAQARATAFAMDPILAREAVPVFAPYLDLETKKWDDHKARLLAWLEKKRAAKLDVLAKPDLLEAIAYRARPFVPFKKNYPDADVRTDESTRITTVNGEGARFAFSLPPGAADPVRQRTVPPWPTVVVLHGREDLGSGRKDDSPGRDVLRRLYLRQGPGKAVTDEWILFAPIAAEANFGADVGRLVIAPFARFWRSHSVDFRRVVLDSGGDALRLAGALPFYFSGVIVRGAGAQVDASRIANLKGTPVFVVGETTSPIVATLRSVGVEPRLGGPGDVPGWLAEICAKPYAPPLDFEWNAGEFASKFAHWVVLNGAEPMAKVAVKVDRAANRIDLTSDKVQAFSFFLNDRIVDLDRPVTVRINGKDAATGAKVVRGLRQTFESLGSNSVLDRLYLGWLYPGFLEQVLVGQAPTVAAPPGTGEGAR